MASESSTEDECETSNLCCIHVCSDVSENIVPFKEKSWSKVLSCAARWKEIDCNEGEIAKRIEERFRIDVDVENPNVRPIPEDAWYHRTCYQRFCHIRRLQAAEERKLKRPEGNDTVTASHEGNDQAVASFQPEQATSSRVLRSTFTGVQHDPERPHVLPDVCIICQSSLRERRITGARCNAKLITCETKEAKTFLDAARLHGDQRILLQIENKDMVAIEVKYHRRCYRNFTRILEARKPKQKEGYVYGPSLTLFGESVIKARIIEGQEILRLKTLTKLFRKCVKDSQGLDASTFSSQRLKLLLKRQFPELVFVKPTKRYESDIVYTNKIKVTRVVERAAEAHPGSSESSTNSETDITATTPHDGESRLRILYHASQVLRSTLQGVQSPVRWPPTADDLTTEVVQKIVPVPVFNFLAWTSGVSNEPDISQFAKISESESRKLFSIAQDLLYFSKKGCIILPKHTSLAMTVRHMTGSAKLVGMLNGFGHCVSHSMVLEHDTALAESQLQGKEETLPVGVQPCFTTLVWDNNDFGEETLSGSGTTHNTNGILIQRSRPLPQPCMNPSIPRTKRRSMKSPDTNIVPYCGQMKKGPIPGGRDIVVKDEAYSTIQTNAHAKDFAFSLSRICSQSGTLLPSWTGYNILMNSTRIPVRSNIFYLPVIDASPTDKGTIYTILLKSVKIADVLQQETLVVVTDQAVYCKLQQIRWQDPHFMKRIIVRMGEFHTAMAFLACIGKRFCDAGLQEVLIEAGVVAQGSLNGVLSGHHYNRSLRAHKVTCEALERLRWQAFLKTLSQDEENKVTDLMHQLQKTFPGIHHTGVILSDDMEDLIRRYEAFVKSQSSQPTFAFWSSYIAMVNLLLRFVRATREGDWLLHLSTIRSFLPWFFAYDHTNYSRYLSVYWFEMQQLQTTHPEINNAFLSGEFVVCRHEEHGFAGVAADQTIEQTINRASKMKGGVVGFTSSQSYFHRWILSQHLRAALQVQCESLAGKGTDTRAMKELDKTRIVRDNKDVQAVHDTLLCMVNPFEDSEDKLLHISSGVVATPSVTENLIQARSIGECATLSFIKERLQEGTTEFHAPVKHQKLQTFSSMTKTKKTKVKGGREVTLKQDRNLFARLLIVSAHRQFDLRDILHHSINTFPLPIANEDGGLNKTNKVSLLKFIESITEPSPIITQIPKQSIWILDGMALIQEINVKAISGMTFGAFASYILQKVLTIATNFFADSIHVVTDRYLPVSIKNAERGRRATLGVERIKIYGPDQAIPNQWKKFLSCGQNKEALVEFIFQRWKVCDPVMFRDVKVFFAHGEMCHSFQSIEGTVNVEPVQQLRCNHEEADTRLLLHCLYVAKQQSSAAANIVIRSPDTDVFILATSMCSEVDAQLFLNTGRGDLLRTLNLNTVAQHLGTSVTNALIGLHCYTGCDSVSSFYGKGKAKALKLIMGNDEFQETFKELGQNFDISSSLRQNLEAFTCSLYGQECDDVNTVRYNMFRMSCKFETSMPPNKDSLQQHIRRANYQAAIHRRALQQFPEIPSPVGHGWKLEDQELAIHWGDLPPAPEDLIAATQCGCKKGKCQTRQCECVKSHVSCTDLCKCSDCKNKDNIAQDEEVFGSNLCDDDGGDDSEADC